MKFLKIFFKKKKKDNGYINTLQYDINYCRICRIIPQCNLKSCIICDRKICEKCSTKVGLKVCSKNCLKIYRESSILF